MSQMEQVVVWNANQNVKRVPPTPSIVIPARQDRLHKMWLTQLMEPFKHVFQPQDVKPVIVQNVWQDQHSHVQFVSPAMPYRAFPAKNVTIQLLLAQ